MRYLVSREGSEYGPYTVEQLTAYVADGSVGPEDWGRAETDQRWVPVREILVGGPAAAPPAPSCTNHRSRPAVCSCVACGRPFCADCVEATGDLARCGPCLRSGAAAPAGAARGGTASPTNLATVALVLSILGIACFGIVVEPIALVLALAARRAIDARGVRLPGRGTATAAIVIASIGLTIWALILLVKVL